MDAQNSVPNCSGSKIVCNLRVGTKQSIKQTGRQGENNKRNTTYSLVIDAGHKKAKLFCQKAHLNNTVV